ncbi:MAG: hypothetical protein J7621_05035 [Niastella sp.]|nr:hypothetical protein [Niastella sp.]
MTITSDSGEQPQRTTADNSLRNIKLIEWGLFIPVLTVATFCFLYYHELGFFLRYQIPIEFIRIEVLNAVQYLPVFLAGLVVSVFMVVLFLDFPASRSTHAYKVANQFRVEKAGIYQVIFLVLVFSALFVYMSSTHIIWLALCFFFGVILLLINKLPGHLSINMRHKGLLATHTLGLCLCMLSSGCLLSFYLGFLERANPGKVYIKKDQQQILLRKYEQYAIYYLPDTSRTTIIIQYSPGEADTLVRVDVKKHLWPNGLR